jgi:hypothetical protein
MLIKNNISMCEKMRYEPVNRTAASSRSCGISSLNEIIFLNIVENAIVVIFDFT